MRRFFVLVGLALPGGSVLVAQEVPTAEACAGYTFIRINAGTQANAFTPSGGLGSFQVNVNRQFENVAEVGGTYKAGVSIRGPDRALEQTQFTYLFGPRIYVPDSKVTGVMQQLDIGPARVAHRLRCVYPNHD